MIVSGTLKLAIRTPEDTLVPIFFSYQDFDNIACTPKKDGMAKRYVTSGKCNEAGIVIDVSLWEYPLGVIHRIDFTFNKNGYEVTEASNNLTFQ